MLDAEGEWSRLRGQLVPPSPEMAMMGLLAFTLRPAAMSKESSGGLGQRGQFFLRVFAKEGSVMLII